jgi:hypothetical protein
MPVYHVGGNADKNSQDAIPNRAQCITGYTLYCNIDLYALYSSSDIMKAIK